MNKEVYKPSANPGSRIGLNIVIIFLPIFSIILIATIIILTTQNRMEMRIFKEAEVNIVNTKLKNIKAEINHVVNDLFILKSNSHFKRVWEEENKNEILEDLTENMVDVIYYHQNYDQARLIDSNGVEIIRVNYNAGKPEVVPAEKLQNKKQRYYFSETYKLARNEVFFSPLDLNIENGEIEQPLKPMIRIGTPIFDTKGTKQGILLFNYFGQKIIDEIDEYINTLVDNQLMLVNANGYLLKGPSPANEWGFMYETKKHIKFSNLYKGAWGKIISEDSSQFETEQGLFTFTTIYPLIDVQKFNDNFDKSDSSGEEQLLSQNYYWKIVSFIPRETLYFNQNQRYRYVFILLTLFSIGLFIVSWKLAKVQYLRKEALVSLKISNKTKDKFFSIIAHDLKGPFTSLLGLSELLVTEIEKGNTTIIKQSGKLLNTTINNTYNFLINLLDWSRSQTDRIKLNPEPFNLSEFVNEISELLQVQADNKQIIINNNIPEDLTINADKNIMHTVIRNLVSNAIKYSNTYGKIKLSASLINSSLHFSVLDNGVGMDEERVNELFNLELMQSTAGTNREEGTGLGLLLCKELIEKHSGKIGVKSELGNGSTFWFKISQ